MFSFRIIDTADGNQVIDHTLYTPYDSLTPIKMMEYIEVDKQIFAMERAKRQQKQVKYKWKFVKKFMHKLEYFFKTIKIN